MNYPSSQPWVKTWMLLHHPLVWVWGSEPLAEGSPPSLRPCSKSPSRASDLPFPALPCCWERGGTSKLGRLRFLQLLPFLRDTQLEPGLACPSWRWQWTRLWLLYKDQPHNKHLPLTTAHLLWSRHTLVPADQALCCSPHRNDSSDGAVSPVPPSRTVHTNWCADKFWLNRKNYFSITVIFPFSPIILMHCVYYFVLWGQQSPKTMLGFWANSNIKKQILPWKCII